MIRHFWKSITSIMTFHHANVYFEHCFCNSVCLTIEDKYILIYIIYISLQELRNKILEARLWLHFFPLVLYFYLVSDLSSLTVVNIEFMLCLVEGLLSTLLYSFSFLSNFILAIRSGDSNLVFHSGYLPLLWGNPPVLRCLKRNPGEGTLVCS